MAFGLQSNLNLVPTDSIEHQTDSRLILHMLVLDSKFIWDQFSMYFYGLLTNVPGNTTISIAIRDETSWQLAPKFMA